MQRSVLRPELLRNQIAEILRSSILDGQPPPGERLVEREWSEKLSVSRTPLREAVQLLIQDGLLKALPFGGSRVRPISLSGLRQAYECRAVLEGLAAFSVASEGRDPDLLRKLADNCEQLRVYVEEGDIKQTIEVNTSFHSMIVAASRNWHLQALATRLSTHIMFYRLHFFRIAMTRPEAREAYRLTLFDSWKGHTSILAALERQDASDAETCIRRHTLDTMRSMWELLQQYDPNLSE